MPVKFFDLREQRLVEPVIIDPAKDVILQIKGNLFRVSSKIREKKKRGILPDQRFILVRWNNFFPYNPYDVGISYEVATPEKIALHNPLMVKPFDYQKLRVNGYGHIMMTISPVGVGSFESCEDVDELMRDLFKFQLIYKHQIDFEYEDFTGHALAPFLHLKKELPLSCGTILENKVIQVKIDQIYKPAISSTDPNGEFTWGKLLNIFDELNLGYCQNDFLPKNIIVGMPEELELGGYQEPFEVIQLLNTKAVYSDYLEDRMVMGFKLAYKPPGENNDLPQLKLESFERYLADPIFPEDQSVGEMSLWLNMNSIESKKS